VVAFGWWTRLQNNKDNGAANFVASKRDIVENKTIKYGSSQYVMYSM
jgi:hypothetical protein